MARENMGLHDQSKLVALAVEEFLIKRGVPIEPGNDLLVFEVLDKSGKAKS